MATIGLFTVGVAGRVYSAIEIARRLGERGHRVVFVTTNTAVPARVERAGYACVVLDDGVPEALREQRRALRPGRGGARARRRIDTQIARARGRAALSGFGVERFLREYRPALLLLESELHDSILYLLGHSPDTPLALLEYHVSVRRRAGVPPLNATYVPRGPLARARSAWLWRRTLIRRRVREVWMRVRERGWDRDSVWRKIAAAAGVSLAAIASRSDWPILHYRALPRLKLSAPEFDFPPPPGSDHRDDVGNDRGDSYVVGPIVQAQRMPRDEGDDASACRALLDRLASSDRPLVACATGSILTLPRLVGKVMAAADGADFDLIIATGRQLDPARLELPDNVHAFRRIPQLEVLAQASLFICHCGIASVHEAILAGVPILACSGGVMDENGNAARVEFHGLGLRGSLEHDSPAQLRGKIQRVLGDPAFGHRVAAMRQSMLRYSREDRLGQVIGALLSGDGRRWGQVS